jgi:acetyl esterase/lipase
MAHLSPVLEDNAMFTTTLLAASLLLGQTRDPSVTPAGGVETFPLWDGKAPLAVGDSRFDKPQLTVYTPENGKANGAAVVICPGGGYGFLATDHEGKQVAELFTKHGVHAFVLQYRIVQKERPGPLGKAPLLDAQRAIRMVRSRAKQYGLDVQRVGLMGFSAGGHLASTAGTHFDNGDPKANDPIDQESCRPNWLVLGYPVVTTDKSVTHGGSLRNLIGEKPTAEELAFFSNEKYVSADTPPTFIFHTDEDTAVPPENALLFVLALKKHKVPCELLLYAKGKHGVGLGTDPAWTGSQGEPHYTADWGDHLIAWCKVMKVFETK